MFMAVIKEFNRAKRHELDMAVISIDIDYFKKLMINMVIRLAIKY